MITRGDIYWVNLDPTQGSEIQKKRPCVILSATPINKARKTVVIIPFSSLTNASPPITVEIHCMQQKGIAVIDQIRTVDQSRLDTFIECIDQQDLDRIELALKQVLVL